MPLTAEIVKKTLEEKSLGDFFDDSSIEALLRFIHKMLEINKIHNLTKWISDEEVLTFHILDSAVSLPLIKELTQNKPQKWLDLGSGCGFPGAVLIAAFPELEITLLDSVEKKANALRECVSAAGWKAEVLSIRAEQAGKDLQTQEKWDGVVARAVADLPLLLKYSMPLLKPGGYLVNWMTENQIKKVNNSKSPLQALGSKIIKTKDYSLPGISQNRTLLVVEKLGKV